MVTKRSKKSIVLTKGQSKGSSENAPKQKFDKEQFLRDVAEIISDNPGGPWDLNIENLVRRLEKKATYKVSRSTIHFVFGREASVKTEIFMTILDQFASLILGQIKMAEKMWGHATEEMENLKFVFRALLAVCEEDEHKPYAKAVFRHLDLNDKNQYKIAAKVFREIDRIIGVAKAKEQLHIEARNMEPYQITQILYGMLRSLLLMILMDKDKSHEDRSSGLTNEEAELQILRVLQLFCSDFAKTSIEQEIKAIRRKQEAGNEAIKEV